MSGMYRQLSSSIDLLTPEIHQAGARSWGTVLSLTTPHTDNHLLYTYMCLLCKYIL